MTGKEKEKIIEEMKNLTSDYFVALKGILEKNSLVYAVEQKTMLYHTPFGGRMPVVNKDMLEDLCLDIVEHPNTIEYSLHEKSYVEQKIAEDKEYNSPKSRILRHIAEIERLKDKYNVTDDELRQ